MSNMLSPISHSRIFTELRMINQTTAYKKNNGDFPILLIWWTNKSKNSQYYSFGTLFQFLNELYRLSTLVLPRLDIGMVCFQLLVEHYSSENGGSVS